MYPELILITSVILVYVINFFIKRYNLNKRLEHVPGPKGWPFIGNMLEFTDSKAILQTIMKFRKQFGRIYRFNIGIIEQPVLVICDNKLAMQILNSTKFLKKAKVYDNSRRWLGSGLLVSRVEKWQKMRKLIVPSFHFNILEQFLDVYNANSNILVKKLDGEVGKSSFDIYPFIALFALDIICETAMGIFIHAQTKGKNAEYVKEVSELADVLIRKSSSAFKQIDFLFKLTIDYQIEKRALKVIHKITESVIMERRKLLNKNNIDKTNNDVIDDIGIKKKIVFLDILLQSSIDGVSLSDSDIKDEVCTFMFGGQDTVSSTLSFCFMSLAQNQDIQKKVYEEVYSIFQDDKERPVTYEDIQEMKYIELVIKETLRLYPSVPVFGRELTSDLEYNGKIYPAGTSAMIIAYAIQRDPKNYEDPDSFKPERFLDKKIDQDAYLPFSAGPRNCVGQKFVMFEMKTTISKVIRHFELEPVQDFKPIMLYELTLKSLNGMQIRLKRR